MCVCERERRGEERGERERKRDLSAKLSFFKKKKKDKSSYKYSPKANLIKTTESNYVPLWSEFAVN